MRDIRVSYENSGAIKNDSTLWISGNNSYGQLGIGSRNDTAEFINTSYKVIDVIFTLNTTLFFDGSSILHGMGDNYNYIINGKSSSYYTTPQSIGFSGNKLASAERTVFYFQENGDGGIAYGLGHDAEGDLNAGEPAQATAFPLAPAGIAVEYIYGLSTSVVMCDVNGRVYYRGSTPTYHDVEYSNEIQKIEGYRVGKR